MIKFVNLPPLTQEEKDAIRRDAEVLYDGSHDPNMNYPLQAYEFGRHHERYLANQEKERLVAEIARQKEQLEGCYEIMKMIAKQKEPHKSKWNIEGL